jgi:hypothetical protein
MKYKEQITIENQPLFIVKQRDSKPDIYLPVSLCHEASLPEDFTKDTFKMANLQKSKITHP